MSRVLVTGASGFIGRRTLAPLVQAGHEVHAVTRGEQAAHAGVRWHQADLLASADVVARVRPETLVHMAWYAEHGSFWSSPENVRWVEASLALLRSFADAGGKRAVLAGTCAEYDWDQGGDALREDFTPLHPATLYGTCKLGLFRVATAFAEQAGLALAWGRVFFLYGPGEAPGRLFASVARALLEGQEARTTDGRQVRDFMHVDDVGAAFAALAASDVGGAVNIGSGTGVTLREVIDEIGRAVGRPDLLRIGALPAREGESARLVADVRRLRDEVDFAPKLTLAAGTAETVRELRRLS